MRPLTLILLTLGLAPLAGTAQQPSLRNNFHVKYVAEGAVYIDAGRASGLGEGAKLVVKRAASGATGDRNPVYGEQVAQLVVISVAETSAVCQVVAPAREIRIGDAVFLAADELAAIALRQGLSGTRKYPQVVTFTTGDPLDEEIREAVPKPPLPEINRARGRIGFDLSGLRGQGIRYSQVGVVFRSDITRLNGTYWNLSGYWRGRLDFRSGGQQSVQDLINRTYHLSLSYDHPKSPWVAGFGRLYVPWATSLDTLDGGYFGRRISKISTAGLFVGSTPDPTSWSYDPQRRIAGAFLNFEGGSFEAFHYTSTTGFGISTLGWKSARPFLFLENSLLYKQLVSIYHSLQADRPSGLPASMNVGAGISRSYLTFRVQATSKLALDVNHNYFRDVPTFDAQLLATGLVDKLLFQGISVGARYELPKRITVYSDVGRNTRSGDSKASWNKMYGVTLGQIWRTGIRADVRQANFSSSFSQGWYRAFSLSRTLGDNVRLEVQGGRQKYSSGLTTDSGSRFLNANADVNLGSRYFVQAAFTNHRGLSQDYNQWSATFGYRFDNRKRH